MFRKILDILVSLTHVKMTVKEVKRTEGEMVFEIYITNYNKYHNGSFGFWEYGCTYEEAAKKAVKHLLTSLKWSYKTRIKKWLRLN